MWLILPMVYVLAWKQTGSWRQAFNATIAWILGFAVVASVILFMDMGGYGGVRAMPDSPAAAIAFLGGFIAMWISNIVWRRRGGDPPREPGRWERAYRAMFSPDSTGKKKRNAKSTQQPPAERSAAPVPGYGTAGVQPVDAQYRQIHPQQSPVAAQPAYSPAYQQSQGYEPAPNQHVPPGTPPGSYPAPPPQFVPGPGQPAPPRPKKSNAGSRQSPTANKYAKATGRALAAMFKEPKKKPKRKRNQQM